MRHYLIAFLYLLSVLPATSCNGQGNPSPAVKVGAEVLLDDHLEELKDKRVGVVMNQSSRLGDTHMLDTLLSSGVNVTAIFAPEHGFRGQAGAGRKIDSSTDPKTGVPILSLYGEHRKPTPKMLENVDVILFDIQDVGARFYTYQVTLGKVLESAAAEGKAVWVLDRPNPAGGEYVAGWILQPEHRSFIGAYPIPVVHGMSLGELAKMMVAEKWIEFDKEPLLKVIPMKGWERSMLWSETGLEWRPPSANLPTFEHAYLYLGTAFIEGTTLSEGRGTDDPFLLIGAPTTEIPMERVRELNRKHPSVTIEKTTFTPQSMPGKSLHPKHEGELCRGLRLHIRNYEKLDPLSFGMELLQLMLEQTEKAEVKSFINNLSGINMKEKPGGIPVNLPGWEKQVAEFKTLRAPYLIY